MTTVTPVVPHTKQYCKVSKKIQNISRCKARGHKHFIKSLTPEVRYDPFKIGQREFIQCMSVNDIPSKRDAKNKKTKGCGGAMIKNYVPVKRRNTRIGRTWDQYYGRDIRG